MYNDRESRKRFIKPKTIVLCDRASVRYNHQTGRDSASGGRGVAEFVSDN